MICENSELQQQKFYYSHAVLIAWAIIKRIYDCMPYIRLVSVFASL